MKRHWPLLALLLHFQLATQAQDKRGFQLLITHENDIFAPANKDENYTGGLKIELQTAALNLSWQPFFRLKKEVAAIQRYSLGGTAYTPQDLANPYIVLGDRPYASLMYASIGRESFAKKGATRLNSEFSIGGIGLPGPGNFQQSLHRSHFLGSKRPVPQGWNNQVGYPGSLILNYNVSLRNLWYHGNRKKTLETDSMESMIQPKKFEWLQLYRVAAADFGNYMINFQAGFNISLFNFNNSPLLNYTPGIIQIINDPVPVPPKKIRANLFVEPIVRLTAFNATLEGLLFNDKSVYTIPAANIRRLLLDVKTGINVLLFEKYYIRYALSARTREYVHGKSLHFWGGITIGYSPKYWNRAGFDRTVNSY